MIRDGAGREATGNMRRNEETIQSIIGGSYACLQEHKLKLSERDRKRGEMIKVLKTRPRRMAGATHIRGC